jgi:linoleoyl-CoA desaturase
MANTISVPNSTQAPDETFTAVLNGRVTAYLTQDHKSRYANNFFYGKALLFLIIWIGNYLLILLGNLPIYWLWIAVAGFGIVSLLLLLNIGHDAVHNAISRKRWVNKLFGFAFNLVGGNAYSWYLKHNVAHHRYTNIEGADMDIDTGPLLRISPLAPYKAHYRYQHLYAPAVYLFSSLALLFYLDFAILGKVRPGQQKARPAEWVMLIATKIFYLIYILLIPYWVLAIPFWQVLAGFLTLHGVVGLLIALIFQPSHYVSGVYFTDRKGEELVRKNWVEHQMATTVDIARGSKLANFLLGGLNTNTIHHIFPGICHVHYIPLSNILKQTADEFGVKYTEFGFMAGIMAHFKYLKEMGRKTYE